MGAESARNIYGTTLVVARRFAHATAPGLIRYYLLAEYQCLQEHLPEAIEKSNCNTSHFDYK